MPRFAINVYKLDHSSIIDTINKKQNLTFHHRRSIQLKLDQLLIEK